MKQLPLTSALICAACCVAMAVVALGGFYFAGFSWPVFAAMGLTTALIFTFFWLFRGISSRAEVEFAEEEKDSDSEVLEGTEAARVGLDGLDA